MTDWKKKLSKPSRRTLVYSKKLNKWIDESQENLAFLELLHEKTQAIIKGIMQADPTLTEQEANSLAIQMYQQQKEKLLQEGEDEPTTEENTSDREHTQVD